MRYLNDMLAKITEFSEELFEISRLVEFPQNNPAKRKALDNYLSSLQLCGEGLAKAKCHLRMAIEKSVACGE
jgi:hypothetical protein